VQHRLFADSWQLHSDEGRHCDRQRLAVWRVVRSFATPFPDSSRPSPVVFKIRPSAAGCAICATHFENRSERAKG